MAIAATLLPEFVHEMAGLRRLIERIPAAQMGYRPHPRSFTLGELANHLVTIPGWVVTTLGGTELDFATPEARALQPKPSSTVPGLLATLDAGVSAAQTALSAAADADFQVVWSLLNGGQVILAMPRIAVYRSFVMNHLIHHRAQATVYLRMLDVPLPGLYGPSADEG